MASSDDNENNLGKIKHKITSNIELFMVVYMNYAASSSFCKMSAMALKLLIQSLDP